MTTHDWTEQTDIKDRTISYFVQGLRTLWSLLGPERPILVLVAGLTVLTTGLEILFSWFLKLGFDALPSAIAAGSWPTALSFAIAGLVVSKVAGILIWRFVREPLALKSLIRLENALPCIAQEKLLALSLGFHERSNTGRQVAKIQKGVEKLLSILSNLLWGFLHSFLYLVMSVGAILMLDWRLGLLFLAPLVPAVWLNLRVYERFTPLWEKWERKKEMASGYFFQSLINVATVQTYSQEARELSTHGEVRVGMVELDTHTSLSVQRYYFAIGALLNGFYLITLVVGINLTVKGEVPLGTVVFIATTGGVVIGSIWEMIHLYSRIMRDLVATQRMKALLDEVPDIVHTPDATTLALPRGELVLENVSFSHTQKVHATIDGVSIVFSPSSFVALVGRSGAGKTTIVRLLARVYDVTSGSVLLDGHDVRTLEVGWYRRLFAFVSQDVELFDASLRYNVLYGALDADDTILDEALEAAHLRSVVYDTKRFPDGTDTEVGERGVRLSGGERQRVGIARAYVALKMGAKVLILDEATSNLDSESERAIQDMLAGIRSTLRFTTVAIAHRLSTIQYADTIVVLDQGKVVEQGSHEELVAHNGVYSRLAELQSLGELRE